jgi:hypothetical protein
MMRTVIRGLAFGIIVGNGAMLMAQGINMGPTPGAWAVYGLGVAMIATVCVALVRR